MARYKQWSYVFLLFFLMSLSYSRNNVWKNEYTLWKDVSSKSPNKVVPHIDLGNAFIRRNALPYAEQEFLLALKINPGDVRALNGLAVVYYKRGQFDEAIRLLEILAVDKADDPYFRNNLGVVYMQKGLLDAAIKEFMTAISLDNKYPDAYSNLGLAFKTKGLLKEAKKEFEHALQLYPDHRDARIQLDEIMRSIKK